MENNIEIKMVCMGTGSYRLNEYRNGVLAKEGKVIYKKWIDARRSQKVAEKFYKEFPKTKLLITA